MLWSLHYASIDGLREFDRGEQETLYSFLASDAVFTHVEREQEDCKCGSGARRGKCDGHEDAAEKKEPSEKEPEKESEDESWMEMDPDESLAANQKGKKKGKKKAKGKKGGKR